MTPKIYTAWFNSAKPDTVGVYQRSYHTANGESAIRFSYWNGEEWGWAAFSIMQAEEQPFVASSAQRLPWRGLTKYGYEEFLNAA